MLADSISGTELAQLWLAQYGLVVSLPRVIPYYTCLECGLGHFSHVEPAEGDFYARLEEFGWYYQSDKPEFEVGRSLVQRSDRVLEVGAARGAFAVDLDCKAYVGIDFNLQAIARPIIPGTDLRPVSLNQLVRAGERFTVVVGFQVLEHVPDPASFLQNCWDVLEPGGSLVLSVPNQESFVGLSVNNVLNLPPHHLSRWSRATFEWVADWLGGNEVTFFEDELAQHHRAWAAHSVASARMRSLLQRPQREVDLSLGHRAVSVLAKLAAPFVPLATQRGHTLTVAISKGHRSDPFS